MSDQPSYEYTLIPYTQLSQDALQGVIEAFVNREGTDYGQIEHTFDDKCDQVLMQLKNKEAHIVFDHDSQSVSILHKDQL